MDQDDLVTVIVSTYNRPNALKYCLKSVSYQTFTNWVVYVIGDNCDERTEKVIKEINNPRIKYYNNPLRFGEQSGCNNIGIALTKTKFIAFMNHDDVWTPDHLEKAIYHLDNSEFYISRTIFSYDVVDGKPQLKYVSNKDRKAKWSFYKHFTTFEPCSSWVLKTESLRKIGYWRQSVEIHRVPLIDFVMRAWRKRIIIHFGKNITCIKCGYHSNMSSDKNQYDYEGKEIGYLIQHFENKKDDNGFLSNEYNFIPIDYRFDIFKNGEIRFKHFLYLLFVNKLTAYLYYYFGLDIYEILNTLIRKRKGHVIADVLRKRTGEFHLQKQSLEKAIELAINSNKEELIN